MKPRAGSFGMFQKNFTKFEQTVDAEVKAAALQYIAAEEHGIILFGRA